MNRTQPWLHIYRKPEGEGDGGTTTQATTTTTEAAATTAATDTATTTATAATAATEAPAFDYAKWAEGLTDPQKKDYAKRFKGVDDILDGSLNLRKDIAGRIKVPGKDASPEDIAAFRNAIGAKDKPEDYKAALPENYQLGEVQTALLSAMQKAAQETGVPATSFEQFTKTYFEMEAAVQEKVTAEVDQYRRDNELALKKEFGANYERYTKAARLFIDQRLGIPEFTHLLEDTVTWNGVSMQLGSHPAVIKMLAQVGLRTAEDGVIGPSVDEVKSIQTQIDELRRQHPVGTPRYTPAIDRQLRDLYARLPAR